jgi:AcrR family transcriptional regulator
MGTSEMPQTSKDQPLRRPVVQKRSAKKIEDILTATERHIAAHGLIDLSTNQIAKNAGISIGTVYHYFDDKEAILAALYSRALDRIWVALVAIDTELGATPNFDHFLELARTRIAAAERDETPQMFLSGLLRGLPAIKKLDAAHNERVIDWLASILRRMGSKLPDAKLNKLSMYLYIVFSSSTWEAFAALGKVDSDIESWRDDIVETLARKAF